MKMLRQFALAAAFALAGAVVWGNWPTLLGLLLGIGLVEIGALIAVGAGKAAQTSENTRIGEGPFDTRGLPLRLAFDKEHPLTVGDVFLNLQFIAVIATLWVALPLAIGGPAIALAAITLPILLVFLTMFFIAVSAQVLGFPKNPFREGR